MIKLVLVCIVLLIWFAILTVFMLFDKPRQITRQEVKDDGENLLNPLDT